MPGTAFDVTPPRRRGLSRRDKAWLGLALFVVLGAAAFVADALAARDGHTPRQYARDPAAFPAQADDLGATPGALAGDDPAGELQNGTSGGPTAAGRVPADGLGESAVAPSATSGTLPPGPPAPASMTPSVPLPASPTIGPTPAPVLPALPVPAPTGLPAPALPPSSTSGLPQLPLGVG